MKTIREALFDLVQEVKFHKAHVGSDLRLRDAMVHAEYSLSQADSEDALAKLRRDFEELNNAAADLVAEAVGPYDPPQRGSNLEKLYLLVGRPLGWQGAKP
jgi:hypothetical protein